MQIKRYWNDDKESVWDASGFITDNGDFVYQGSMDLCTIYKNHHYATVREAALDLIKQIYGDIKAFEERKARITAKYLDKQEPMDITNRVVKICRRITEIEHALACKDQSEQKTSELKDELERLELELETLHPAV